jgi:hypothetical protein
LRTVVRNDFFQSSLLFRREFYHFDELFVPSRRLTTIERIEAQSLSAELPKTASPERLSTLCLPLSLSQTLSLRLPLSALPAATRLGDSIEGECEDGNDDRRNPENTFVHVGSPNFVGGKNYPVTLPNPAGFVKYRKKTGYLRFLPFFAAPDWSSRKTSTAYKRLNPVEGFSEYIKTCGK